VHNQSCAKRGQIAFLPPFGQNRVINPALSRGLRQGNIAARVQARTTLNRSLTMFVEWDLTVSWLLERLENR
jgi:hypothetical protein